MITNVIQASYQCAFAAGRTRAPVTELDPATLQLHGSIGRALPDELRAKMEAFFGVDFSSVRIHQGPHAAAIGAQAFAMGSGIWFAPGQYAPNTPRGQQLIGHELTHVVQQRSGRVRAPGGARLVIVNDAALEAEADRLGARAAASRGPVPTPPRNRPDPIQGKRGVATQSAMPAAMGALTRDSCVKSQTQTQLVQPMWATLFGGNARADPPGASGRVYRYMEGATEHARDDKGQHWWVNHHGTWTQVPTQTVQPHTHGRGTTEWHPVTGLTHGLKNMVSLQGGWSWARLLFTGRKFKRFDVAHVYHPQRRTYSQAMDNAAREETGDPTGWTATRYARHFGGHRNINYEWCHLASFGHAGNDNVDNVVAATEYQNTEQMAVEHGLEFFKDKGLSVTVIANLVRGTHHLAESIIYQIWYGNFLVYTRTMDARRATEPTHYEITRIKRAVRRSVGKALSRGTVRRFVQGWTLDYLDAPGWTGVGP